MKNKNMGRPKGASRYNDADAAILTNVAQMIVNEEANVPTEAMRKLGASEESQIRRLQRKWRDGKEQYLQQSKRGNARSASVYTSKMPYQSVADRLAGELNRISSVTELADAHRAAIDSFSATKLDTALGGIRAQIEQLETAAKLSRAYMPTSQMVQEAMRGMSAMRALQDEMRQRAAYSFWA